MKIEEAIEHLRDINTVAKTRHMMRDIDGDLEDGEVQLYRERFEAVKMGMAALEKQIPKKPLFKTNYSAYSCYYACPSCGALVTEHMNYCSGNRDYGEPSERGCGQKLNWGD